MNILLDSNGEADFTSDLFWDRVYVLLDWSVTPLQYGDHRIYAVANVLRQSKQKLDEQLALRDPSCPRGDALFQIRLFEWLNTSKTVGELENRRTVAPLLGQLIKLELFSYPQYVQRLIARGDVGLGPPTVSPPAWIYEPFSPNGTGKFPTLQPPYVDIHR
jgi:mediator of RNA polymerase II transcription subunit 12